MDLDSLIREIARAEQKKKLAGEKLRKRGSDFISSPEILEDKLILNAEVNPLKKAKVVGVDGGLIKKRLYNMDLVLTRAVAAIFVYENGKLTQVNYSPSSNPLPDSSVINTQNRHDFTIASSLIRMRKEVVTAISALKLNPDIVLLDGSLVPHYCDRPARDSPSYETYLDVVSLYKDLVKKCESSGIMLAGVDEDPHTTRFFKIIRELVSLNMDPKLFMRDIEFLNYILSAGERTPVFKYAKNPEEHPTLKDTNFGKKVFSIYVKAVKNDFPLKVDFLASGDPIKTIKTAREIVSYVYTLSALNSAYSYPSVLIDADQRAKLSSMHLDFVKSRICTKLALNSLDMRRDRRPF